MNPGSVTDAFGTARRRNVPFFQFLYTMLLYVVVLFFLAAIASGSGGEKRTAPASPEATNATTAPPAASPSQSAPDPTPPLNQDSSPATSPSVPDASHEQQAESAMPSSPRPDGSLSSFVIAKTTSLYDLDESLPIALKPLTVGTKVRGVGSTRAGWEHVLIPGADESRPDEDGYVPLWAIEPDPPAPAPRAKSP